MSREIWVPLIVVGIPGVLLTFHTLMRRVRRDAFEGTEARIEEALGVAVPAALGPLEKRLETITVKMDNGLITSSQKHTEEIKHVQIEVAKLSVHVANLTSQVERLLISKGIA